jgi:hypothetical protein
MPGNITHDYTSVMHIYATRLLSFSSLLLLEEGDSSDWPDKITHRADVTGRPTWYDDPTDRDEEAYSMTIWQLKSDDVEAVVTQIRSGMTTKQVAEALDISEEMVICAIRKGPSLRRKSIWGTF